MRGREKASLGFNGLYGFLGFVFLMGCVSAGVIDNVTGIILPVSSVYGGEVFEGDFSFEYLDNYGNLGNSPLVIRLEFESNDSAFPVWLGDFEVWGYLDKSFAGIWSRKVWFDCSETESFGRNVSNGTFYCFDEDGYLDLGERDDVKIFVRGEVNVWPGEYNISARLFWLEDEAAPIVEILNVGDFDGYYRELDNVEVLASVIEMNLDETWGRVDFGGENMSVPYVYFEAGFYHYSKVLPIDVVEGEYSLGIFARDLNGLEGSDFVLLKIDRSAPVISLVGGLPVASGNMSVNVSVVDGKSGVDVESVEFRLRERDGLSICPGSGVGMDCYNSGWVLMDSLGDGFFGGVVDTVEAGLNGEK